MQDLSHYEDRGYIMNWLFFSIATALLWGTAELFYKKGAQPNEKYSHLKICVWVGIVMGAHAIFTLLTQDINFNPINLICYLPVSLFYIVSMAFSYFGMRFLEESISDPIENTAGVICVLLFALIMGDSFHPLTWIAVVVIGIGVFGVGYMENKGDTPRKRTYGKKLAPFVRSGLVCKEGERYFFSRQGLLVSNTILSEILDFESQT